eukprot:364258-Chlamydomonas_euryale.AAC.1
MRVRWTRRERESVGRGVAARGPPPHWHAPALTPTTTVGSAAGDGTREQRTATPRRGGAAPRQPKPPSPAPSAAAILTERNAARLGGPTGWFQGAALRARRAMRGCR